MKRLFVLAFVVIGATALMAQNTKKMVVENMHCKNCALNVEKILTSIDGVKSVDVDLAKKEVTVDYDAKKVTSEKLISAFANTKYKVLDQAVKNGCCKDGKGCGKKEKCDKTKHATKGCDKAKEKKECDKTKEGEKKCVKDK